MFSSFATVAGLAALATSVSGSSVLLMNNCADSVWLTFVNSTQVAQGPFEVPSYKSFEEAIVGDGNSYGVSMSNDYYSSDVPKLILGASSDDGTLYWSVSDVDGSPFADGETFTVTSVTGDTPNACSNTSTADGTVYACADTDITLTLNACAESEIYG